jgi:ketosteroid isomerase-like protein
MVIQVEKNNFILLRRIFLMIIYTFPVIYPNLFNQQNSRIMKQLLTIIFAVALFSSCEQKETRYTQQSPEIDIVKQDIQDYNNMKYDRSMYIDTCKTFFNTKTEPMGNDEAVAFHQENDALYSSRKFLDEDQEYEMVVTDNGETWVNAWLDWQGTLKANGKVIDIPIHLTYKFVDGKIARLVGYWNSAEIVLSLQEIEKEQAAQTEPAEE